MADIERPLPDPPRTRFGRQVRGEEGGAAPLAADRLAQAAAEGRLEEVLEHEIPGGEHARNLAMMMLGMSGMLPGGGAGMPAMAAVPGMPGVSGMPEMPEMPAAALPPVAAGGGEAPVPPEVLAATMQADVAGLMAMLRAEHERRGGGAAAAGDEPGPAPGLAPAPAAGAMFPQQAAGGAAPAGIDQALVDELIRVAADNQVTVDWLLLRAVKLYLEEHRRSGRL